MSSTTAKSSASVSVDRRRPSVPGVVLDANMLFLAVRRGFPLEAEVDRARPGAPLLVPASVVAELDGLARSLTPGALAARALAERYATVPTTASGDDGVLEAALREHAWLATADRELRRRAAIRGITTLVPRDRHRLEVVRPRVRAERGSPPASRRRPAAGNG